MTDMLQKSENVANNVANKNSQDLTEQWKKGELPEGHYYVKDGENMIAEYIDGYFYNNGEPMTSFTGGVDEVLERVPTFDEWEQLQNWAYFTDDYHELREKLEIAEYENSQLKEQINKWCLDAINRGTANAVKAVKEFGMPERIKELVEQNKQLKELLKLARSSVDYHCALCREYTDGKILIAKIDEALK